MVNTEQLAAWDGEQGSFWARRADRFDAGVAAHRGELRRAGGIAATDRSSTSAVVPVRAPATRPAGPR